MKWETPQTTEIKMDAEIGSYQQDDGDWFEVVRPAKAAPPPEDAPPAE